MIYQLFNYINKFQVIVVKNSQPPPSSRVKQMTPAEEAEARRRLVDAKV